MIIHYRCLMAGKVNGASLRNGTAEMLDSRSNRPIGAGIRGVELSAVNDRSQRRGNDERRLLGRKPSWSKGRSNQNASASEGQMRPERGGASDPPTNSQGGAPITVPHTHTQCHTQGGCRSCCPSVLLPRQNYSVETFPFCL